MPVSIVATGVSAIYHKPGTFKEVDNYTALGIHLRAHCPLASFSTYDPENKHTAYEQFVGTSRRVVINTIPRRPNAAKKMPLETWSKVSADIKAAIIAEVRDKHGDIDLFEGQWVMTPLCQAIINVQNMNDKKRNRLRDATAEELAAAGIDVPPNELLLATAPQPRKEENVVLSTPDQRRAEKKRERAESLASGPKKEEKKPRFAGTAPPSEPFTSVTSEMVKDEEDGNEIGFCESGCGKECMVIDGHVFPRCEAHTPRIKRTAKELENISQRELSV